MENVAIELKSYSQTIKLLKSLFVGSTAEALLTRQFVLRTVQHRIGRKLKADRQNSPREQTRPRVVIGHCNLCCRGFQRINFFGMEKRQKVRNDVCLVPAARPRSLHLMPDPARAVQTARRNKMAFCKSFYKDRIS